MSYELFLKVWSVQLHILNIEWVHPCLYHLLPQRSTAILCLRCKFERYIEWTRVDQQPQVHQVNHQISTTSSSCKKKVQLQVNHIKLGRQVNPGSGKITSLKWKSTAYKYYLSQSINCSQDSSIICSKHLNDKISQKCSPKPVPYRK